MRAIPGFRLDRVRCSSDRDEGTEDVLSNSLCVTTLSEAHASILCQKDPWTIARRLAEINWHDTVNGRIFILSRQ